MTDYYRHLLSPVADEEFLASYREQAPLHIERSDSEHFQRLLSSDDIEMLLSAGSQFYPDVQLVNAAADIPMGEYTDSDRRIVTPGLWAHYRRGATVVISGAERQFYQLSDLCRSVSTELCMRSQANLYLSPGSHQGFGPHYDTHDVFVLQVSGSKEFRFYRSDIELPFCEETFPSDYIVDSEVQETVLLTAGDTLYIPRGFIHDAVAQSDEPSLHITLGVFPIVLRDLVQEMVQAIAENDVDFRRAIDLREPVTDALLHKVRDSLSTAVNTSLYETARSRLADDVVIGMTPSSRGQLSALLAPDVEDTSTTIRLTIDNDVLIGAESIGSALKLRAAGQVIEFAQPYAAAVQMLLDQGEIMLNDLVGLDQEQRQALLSQLQNVNCVRIELDS